MTNTTLPDAFRLASISKTVVATLVLRTVAQKKLDLDVDASQYLDLRELKGRTLRQLLSHTSGLPTYDQAEGFWTTQNRDVTPMQLLEYGRKLPRQPAPSGFRYANTNFVLAALILEKIHGKPFAEQARTLAGELALPSLHPETRQDVVAPSFDKSGNQVGLHFRPSMLFAAGDFVASLGDTTEWTRRWGSGSLIDPALHADWLKPHPTGERRVSYGLGLFLQTHKSLGPVRSHAGNLSGVHTFAAYYVDLQAAVVALGTRDGLDASLAAEQLGLWLKRELGGAPAP
jgi:D-alanyl-D-alanine carboxypeptidase